MMNVPEATVHTVVSFDESVTVSDELAVGDTANPTDDQLRPAGAAKEIFCDAWAMFTVALDAVIAAY